MSSWNTWGIAFYGFLQIGLYFGPIIFKTGSHQQFLVEPFHAEFRLNLWSCMREARGNSVWRYVNWVLLPISAGEGHFSSNAREIWRMSLRISKQSPIKEVQAACSFEIWLSLAFAQYARRHVASSLLTCGKGMHQTSARIAAALSGFRCFSEFLRPNTGIFP
jgi:hypothetical protein